VNGRAFFISSTAAMSLDRSSLPAAYETYRENGMLAIFKSDLGSRCFKLTKGSLHSAGRLNEPSVELLSMTANITVQYCLTG
jgi:hypothetical protein